MYLFIFNGIYAVLADTKQEAKRKLANYPHLHPYHKWYFEKSAEDPTEQGYLSIQQKDIVSGVIVL